MEPEFTEDMLDTYRGPENLWWWVDSLEVCYKVGLGISLGSVIESSDFKVCYEEM